MLMRIAVFFIRCNSALPINPCVLLSSGVCNVTTSDRSSNSFNSTLDAPKFSAFSLRILSV